MSHYRPLSERTHDFKPVETLPGEEELRLELVRCQDCGIPFCHASGCPLQNAVPEVNAAALDGRWGTALRRLLATSPFPEFTARLCPALCEGSCVQGLHDLPVPCRRVELAVIEHGFARQWVRPRPPKQRRGPTVAVIGSGPAGLAAAWRLNQGGARVTVYERDARPGGFLRYGIPDFKLDKEILDRRIRLLEQEGILFECGVDAGTDFSGRLLRQRHGVLVLAVGARQKRDLPVPGRSLSGILFATDYLAAQNRVVSGEQAALPEEFSARRKRVIVIGGGDTGSDCVGTAWRQGAISVLQLEIMPKPLERRGPDNPWPQWPRVLRTSSSHEEGGERRWNVMTTAFSADPDRPDRVSAACCAPVAWKTDQGRLQPVVADDSGFVLQTDLVLLAMGFTGIRADPLLEYLGMRPDASGRLPRDAGGRLPEADAYACGDAALGPSLVVRAISDGLRVAERIIEDIF
ncbi:MAG: glutamate synthase subunit beta [Desulfovibrio sp.]|jgi:glutamate synthase (NADPH/NADH) small chain|nr:glutamate synthase subunit beta [Desulfovibrio sp.]